MNGLENGERGRQRTTTTTYTYTHRTMAPPFLPPRQRFYRPLRVAAWKDPRKIDLAPECRISVQARIFSVLGAGENASVLARAPGRYRVISLLLYS